jgi:gibberellin A4 carboxyl methyltransferase
MKDAGYYDRYSTAQLASMQVVFDWIDQAAATLPFPSASQPFTILDHGCSEGRNALIATNKVVESLRRRQPDQVVQTIYNDLPTSNFNRLFLNLDEARKTGGIASGVYHSAVAGSFYEQLVPSSSVHFALAFNAILWLDRLPEPPVSDFVVYRRPHPPRPGLHVSPELAAAFADQANRDLVRFLESRARELAPGGKLLIVSPGDSTDRRLADGLYDVLNDACLDLIEAGRLPRDRYERFTMPLYFRTVAETLKPLKAEDSPVRGAFSVDRAETLETPTPFILQFDRDGDAVKYAEEYTGFLRAFSEPVARAALVHDEEDDGVIDALYKRVKSRLQAEPERYRFRYLLTATLFTRS